MNLENKTDRELALLAKNSFDGLRSDIIGIFYKKYRNKICCYINYMVLHNKEDAEDIVQDTFIKVQKNINRYEDTCEFSTWIYTIAKNLCFTFLRKKEKMTGTKVNNDYEFQELENKKIDISQIEQELFPSQDKLVEKEEILKIVNNEIDKLPYNMRKTLRRFYNDGFIYKEAAKKDHIVLGTVKSRISRAKIQLKEALKEYVC